MLIISQKCDIMQYKCVFIKYDWRKGLSIAVRKAVQAASELPAALKGSSEMDNNMVDIKKIMAEIKSKANGVDCKGDIVDIDGMPSQLTERMKNKIKEEDIKTDLEIINSEYHAEYNLAADAGSPIRAKLGSMIRVRVTPVFNKRNNWCASAVRLFNYLSKQVSEIKRSVDKSDPELMRVQIDELEMKLRMATKQIELLGSRITELEKAVNKDEA